MSAEFSLDTEEQDCLISMARNGILCGFLNNNISAQIADFNSPQLKTLYEKLGVFVTIKIQGHLRGCIGTIITEEPLYSGVTKMAYAAAFQDSRFPPLTLNEWKQSDNEISILGPLVQCDDIDAIELGKHGLLLRDKDCSGVFLPKVPIEQGWDKMAYLNNLCIKANLEHRSWENKKAQLFTFETFSIFFDANIKDGHQLPLYAR